MNQRELKLLLGDIDLLAKQLENIRRRVEDAYTHSSANPANGGEIPPGPNPMYDRDNEPDLTLLVGLPCPICSAAMRWKYSKTNGQWFAGCVNFQPKGSSGCRGSRSYTKVMDSFMKAKSPPQIDLGPLPPPVEPPPVEGPTTSSRDPLTREQAAAANVRLMHGEDAGDPGPLPEVLPYTLDDYERIEKHHGPEAADELDVNGDKVKLF